MNQTKLSFAESSIFSRAATCRLKPELAYLKFKSIELQDQNVHIDTNEGEIILPKDIYVAHFIEYRDRCPDYFDYVGPKYENRVLWRPGFYFLPIGWVTRSRHCLHSDVLVGQYNIMKTLKTIKSYQTLNEMISYPGQQYGYLVAHEGLKDSIAGTSIPTETPFCSCGSFQVQWNHRDEFKQILGNTYQPSCKHIRYMHEFDQLRLKSSSLLYEQSKTRQYKTLAYWYIPPESNTDMGVLKALYINDQPMRTINHWNIYNTKSPITQDQVWKFFHTALDNGYLIKYAMSIPTLRDFCKHYQD